MLLPSGLHTEQRQQVAALARAAGARLVDQWEGAVTHVVCAVDEYGTARCAAGTGSTENSPHVEDSTGLQGWQVCEAHERGAAMTKRKRCAVL